MRETEPLNRIAAAKAAMDNGFSRLGGGLSGTADEGALVGGADRIIRLANAAALLCRHHHAPEARPLVRALAEAAAGLRRPGAREAWRARVDALLAGGDGKVRSSLPWAHRFHEHQEAAIAPEQVLEAVALCMEEALRALDERWPGSFQGAS